jgi:hypothetical protein
MSLALTAAMIQARLKNSRTQELKNSRTQELKNSRTQELKNSRTQELKKPKNGAMRNSARDPVPSPLICEICEICGSKFGI